jgi:glycerol-3-phosphate dehydrogenase subunit B
MMQPGNYIEADVAVIGAGLAGQASALFAAGQGLRVVQVGRPGVFSLASGLLDLAAPGADRARNRDPLAAASDLVRTEPDHPYALLGPSFIEAAFGEFLNSLRAGGLNYRWRPGVNVEVATSIGSIKTTYAVPEAMWPGVQALADRRPTLVVGFDNLRDFSAPLMVSALNPAWPELRAAAVPWPLTKISVCLGEITARNFEQDEILERLARSIRPLIGPAEAIGLPAVLGLDRHQSVVTRLSFMLGRPVFEVPTVPPSAPGLRLLETLRRLHFKNGVTLIWDQEVTAVECGPPGFGLTVGGGGCTTAVRCGAVILATGRFLGRGLRADRRQVRETIFDLPVTQPADRSRWHARGFFEPHAINRAGLRVDEAFRPVDASGGPFHPRLYAVGSILAGQDWIQQQCGAGLSLSTAYAAVQSLIRSLSTGLAYRRAEG